VSELSALAQEGGIVLLSIFAASAVGWSLLLWEVLSRPDAPRVAARSTLEAELLWLAAHERLAFDRTVLRVVGALAAAAPLLGLLGTVLGMMETFAFLGRADVPRADALAGGVSQALVTTQAGLIVALTLLGGRIWLARDIEHRSALGGER